MVYYQINYYRIRYYIDIMARWKNIDSFTVGVMISFDSVTFLLVFPDCDASCLTCIGPHAGSCTSCRDGQKLEGHGHCVPSANKCSPRQYSDQDGECHPCHKYCHRCSGPGRTHCLSCNQRHLLLSESSLKSLKSACPGKLSRHLWLVCVAAWSCVFVSTDGTCVEECPIGYYEEESGQKCEPCHPSCQSCIGKHSHECLACKTHLFREGKECVETCQHR